MMVCVRHGLHMAMDTKDMAMGVVNRDPRNRTQKTGAAIFNWTCH